MRRRWQLTFDRKRPTCWRARTASHTTGGLRRSGAMPLETGAPKKSRRKDRWEKRSRHEEAAGEVMAPQGSWSGERKEADWGAVDSCGSSVFKGTGWVLWTRPELLDSWDPLQDHAFDAHEAAGRLDAQRRSVEQNE